MAKQPNAYKKFVATAATATLVASAVVPVASAAPVDSFKDVSKTYTEAVNYLIDNGIAKGTSDTTFGTTSNISRGDAAVMIANALKLDTANAKDAGFQDLNTRVEGAVNAIVEAKIASGKTSTKFDPAAYITRQEMAKMLANAYTLTSTSKADFKDVNANWIDYVSALKEAGITLGTSETTFSPTNNLTRGEFALFVFRAETNPPTPIEPGVVAIESVKATNAKTLTVTFNSAVDTSKANLEVVKSNIKQNVSKATWAADGKSATLELSTKLTKGEYTVNVTGLSDQKISASVTVQDEMVQSVEILSDIAVVDDNTTPTTATVGYQVKNQYGEDITKTTSLSTNDTTNVSASNGVVTISNMTGKKVGDKIAVTLIHVDSAKSDTKVLTLSAEASVSDVAIKGLYNKDGKALNEDSKVAEGHYLLVDLKDQYGNAVTDASKATDLIVAESNPTVVGLEGTAPAVTLTSLTIDGKKQLAVKLDAISKAGESQVTLISKTSGKSSAFNIVVAETTRADVVNLSAPALAVAKEDVLIPVSVMDKEGKAITDAKILNNPTKGVTLNLNSQFVTKDGELFVVVPKSEVQTKGVYSILAQSATNKVSTLTLTVKEEAKATTVRGLKNNLALAAGKSKTLTSADVVLEDQYGREMTKTDVDAYLTTGKGILVKKADTAATVVTLPGTTTTNTIKTGSGVQVTAGSANGSETLQFVLADANGTSEIAASTAESTVRVTDGTEYDGYEIAPLGMVQDATTASGNKALTVNGLLNGGKVALVQGASNDYTATISGGNGAASVTGGEIIVPKSDLNEEPAGTKVDTEYTVKVTINATGKVLEQKFTVSPDAAKAQDFFFTTSAVAMNHTGAKAITEATIASGSTIADLKNGGAVVNFATTDQYENEKVVTAATAAPVVTIVPEKVADVTIANNGTNSATVTLKPGITEAKVTYKVKVGNAMKDVKVTVTP